jgi:DNA-binding CsgD family transcriptional regulator
MRDIQNPSAQVSLESALTEREIEILRQVALGKTNQEIADELVVSERTVRTHITNILAKLRLSNRTQAALYALREGIAHMRYTTRRTTKSKTAQPARQITAAFPRPGLTQMQYIDALSKVLPVILLILLGSLLNRSKFLQPDTSRKLRAGDQHHLACSPVPGVCPGKFPGHLVIVGLVFAACVLILLRPTAGPLADQLSYFSPLLTGFEAGMTARHLRRSLRDRKLVQVCSWTWDR